MTSWRMVNLVFFGGPGEEPRFIEAEDDDGKSIRVGEWIEGVSGYWTLRLKVGDEAGSEVIVNTQWRPMETAPRDGTVIEMLSVDGKSIFVRWSERQWVSPQTIARRIRIFLEGSAWRTVHPEWAEHVQSLETPAKRGVK